MPSDHFGTLRVSPATNWPAAYTGRWLNSQCQTGTVDNPSGMPMPIKADTRGALRFDCASTMPAPIMGGIADSITLT